MTYRVEWSELALRQLFKIPKKQRLMILSWVEENLDGCDNPRALPSGKQLQKTQSGWRWRVGSYRILGRIEDDRLVVDVVRIGHRQGVYSNLPKLRAATGALAPTAEPYLPSFLSKAVHM